MTQPSSPLRKKRTSSSRLRSDLIYKLGVRDRESLQSLAAQRAPSRGGTLLGNVKIRSEPLKVKEEAGAKRRSGKLFWNSLGTVFGVPASSERSVSSVTTETSSSTGTSIPSVAFNDEVTVIPIPKREEYSQRVQQRLWLRAEELNAAADRNTIEFAAEGFNWRTATEDEYMYRCVLSGELIHPVHFQEQVNSHFDEMKYEENYEESIS